MSSTVEVDRLSFVFEDALVVAKYDSWAFYRKRFAKMLSGIKAVDLIVLDQQNRTWFVEVKDYRMHPRGKPSELHEEVTSKVLHTLAALLPAKLSGDVEEECAFARRALESRQLRVVLHLEQQTTNSRLRPRAINPADILQKLRKTLKPIDAHPVVCESAAMSSVPWDIG